MFSQAILPEKYWDDVKVEKEDFSFLFNHLLECETPLTTGELVKELVQDRIVQEKKRLVEKQKSAGKLYLPKDHYKTGESLTFPQFDGKKGKILSIHPGNNPEFPPFDVIEVKLEDDSVHLLASGLESHALNELPTTAEGDVNLDPDHVLTTHSTALEELLGKALNDRPDLVRIAGRWFPKSLLVDVNTGHLNLAEATLDMANGGPLPIGELQKQVELSSDVNAKLLEFSLNYALQEDPRFDEVGPTGEVLWHLHRCEPEEVRETPLWLQYKPEKTDKVDLSQEMQSFCGRMADELDECEETAFHEDEVVLSLLYPHWRAGTLPLNHLDAGIFPSAIESPRVQFTFENGNTHDKFTGWVVRPGKYLFGSEGIL